MRILFLLGMLYSSSLLAQCFEEPAFNQVLEEALKVKCQDFPAIVKLPSIKIEGQDVSFYPADIARLDVKGFEVSGIEKTESKITITLKGDIRFHPSVREIFFGKLVKHIDDRAGDISFIGIYHIYTRYFPKLLSKLPDSYSALAIEADATDELDFSMREVSGGLQVNGAAVVKNLNIKYARYIEIVSGKDGESKPAVVTKVSNLNFRTGRLMLRNASFEPTDKKYAIDNLKLYNARIEGQGLKLDPESNLKLIEMVNSRLLLRETPLVNGLEDIDLLDSVITGTVIETQLAKLYSLSAVKSSVIFSGIPTSPELTSLYLVGQDISFQNQEGAFKINAEIEEIKLINTRLRDLKIDLLDPKAFMSLDLTDNKLNSLEILHPENVSLVPKGFSAYAPDAGSARIIRRVFKTKAVAQDNWLPL